MSNSASAFLDQDQFLTECLGRTVYNLSDLRRASDALSVANKQSAWMIQVKVPVESTRDVHELTQLGFSLIDVNVQLEFVGSSLNLMSASSDTYEIREACSDDRASVEEISAETLVTSRFHLDPHIEPAFSRLLKRRWAGNFFEGKRGDRMLVALRSGTVVGFLLTLERQGRGIVDLITLDPTARGNGLPGKMMSAWLEVAPDLRQLLVGTQISNVAALRAYQKLGFRHKSSSYALHMHGFAAKTNNYGMKVLP